MPPLWQLTATQIADAVRRKHLTAVEVTIAHLERLATVNPTLNAVVQEFPDAALDAARTVDAQIAGGQDPGPVHPLV